MARKTTVFVATSERDKGKHFVITEMSAMKAEKWAAKALFAIGRAGVEIPPDLMGAGMAGIAVVGIKAITSLAFEEADPLLDEMMGCAVFMPSPDKPMVTRVPREDDIEDVATILALRDEVVKLHLGFSIAACLSELGAAAKVQASNDTPTSPKT